MRLAIAALFVVASLSGAGGAVVANAWIDAKRDENAQQFGCLVGVNADDDTAYTVVERYGSYVCVFLDEEGRVIQEVPADTGIGRGDAVAAIVIAAVIASAFGLLLALGVIAMAWLVWQAARALRPTLQV